MIQLPEESLPRFPVNTTCFPADKVMNPPQGAVLLDIDRKPRQAMARSPGLGARECEKVTWGRGGERENGLACLLLIVAIQ